MTPTTSEPTPLRADAERRRRAILDAAAQVFADEGVDAPMERVARAAGVGVATLYRRFPDRTRLVVAVIEDSLARSIETLHAAVAECGTAWEVLTHALDHPQRMRLSLRPQLAQAPGLAEAVRADDGVRRRQAELVGLLDVVVERAQREGSVRRDVGAGDVAILFGMLARRPAVAHADAALATERVRMLVLDALRPREDTTPTLLPGEPLPPSALGLATDARPRD